MQRSNFEDNYESSFAKWLEGLDPEVTFLAFGGAKGWVRKVYEENGDMPSKQFAEVAFERKSQISWDAFNSVVESARQATGLEIAIMPEYFYPSPEDPEGKVTVGGAAIDSYDCQEVHAEIAEVIQEYLMGRYVTVWPECSDHRAGMHAVTWDGKAVWWCNTGDHPGGRISPADSV